MPDDRFSYRRGAVLGFTIAELVLLLIFVLLLVFGVFLSKLKLGLNQEKSENEQLRHDEQTLEAENKELRKEVEAVRALVEKVTARKGGASADQFDDFFRELVLARDDKERLARQVAALQEKVDAYDHMLTLLSSDGKMGATAEQLAGAIEAAAKEKQAVRALLGSDADGSEAGNEIDKLRLLVETGRDSRRTIDRLKQQLASLTKKDLGKGASYPPCWMNPDTGKADYIFDLAMREDGVIVRDIDDPHHATEKALLPISRVRFETMQRVEEFLESTHELFALSERENCRHYIRLFDETKSNKDAFKSQMLAIEGQFYKFLTQDTFAQK
jgi:hypothetical protein